MCAMCEYKVLHLLYTHNINSSAFNFFSFLCHQHSVLQSMRYRIHISAVFSVCQVPQKIQSFSCTAQTLIYPQRHLLIELSK